MADLINSVMDVNPFLPIALDPISSVRDLGILIEVYSFSAIGKSKFDVYISSFCTFYEPPKRKIINIEPHILNLWFMNGDLMSHQTGEMKYMNKGDGMNEWKEN